MYVAFTLVVDFLQYHQISCVDVFRHMIDLLKAHNTWIADVDIWIADVDTWIADVDIWIADVDTRRPQCDPCRFHCSSS